MSSRKDDHTPEPAPEQGPDARKPPPTSSAPPAPSSDARGSASSAPGHAPDPSQDLPQDRRREEGAPQPASRQELSRAKTGISRGVVASGINLFRQLEASSNKARPLAPPPFRKIAVPVEQATKAGAESAPSQGRSPAPVKLPDQREDSASSSRPGIELPGKPPVDRNTQNAGRQEISKQKGLSDSRPGKPVVDTSTSRSFVSSSRRPTIGSDARPPPAPDILQPLVSQKTLAGETPRRVYGKGTQFCRHGKLDPGCIFPNPDRPAFVGSKAGRGQVDALSPWSVVARRAEQADIEFGMAVCHECMLEHAKKAKEEDTATVAALPPTPTNDNHPSANAEAPKSREQAVAPTVLDNHPGPENQSNSTNSQPGVNNIVHRVPAPGTELPATTPSAVKAEPARGSDKPEVHEDPKAQPPRDVPASESEESRDAVKAVDAGKEQPKPNASRTENTRPNASSAHEDPPLVQELTDLAHVLDMILHSHRANLRQITEALGGELDHLEADYEHAALHDTTGLPIPHDTVAVVAGKLRSSCGQIEWLLGYVEGELGFWDRGGRTEREAIMTSVTGETAMEIQEERAEAVGLKTPHRVPRPLRTARLDANDGRQPARKAGGLKKPGRRRSKTVGFALPQG